MNSEAVYQMFNFVSKFVFREKNDNFLKKSFKMVLKQIIIKAYVRSFKFKLTSKLTLKRESEIFFLKIVYLIFAKAA